MKFFVTGVAGQLGHNVMNELIKRGYIGVDSDIAPKYNGNQDETAMTTMEYVSVHHRCGYGGAGLDKNPAGFSYHCATLNAVDMVEDDDKAEKVRDINAGGTKNIAKAYKTLD